MSDLTERMTRGSQGQVDHVARHVAEQYGAGKSTLKEAAETLDALGISERVARSS